MLGVIDQRGQKAPSPRRSSLLIQMEVKKEVKKENPSLPSHCRGHREDRRVLPQDPSGCKFTRIEAPRLKKINQHQRQRPARTQEGLRSELE